MAGRTMVHVGYDAGNTTQQVINQARENLQNTNPSLHAPKREVHLGGQRGVVKAKSPMTPEQEETNRMKQEQKKADSGAML